MRTLFPWLSAGWLISASSTAIATVRRFAYVWLGMIAGPHFDNYKAGFRFGQLGYELVEKRGLTRFQARTYMNLGSHRHALDETRPGWPRSGAAGVRCCQRRSAISLLRHTAVSTWARTCLAAGDPLVEVQREAENGLEFAQKARFGLVIELFTAQLGLIRTLRGLTPKFGSFDDEQFDELRFERRLAKPRIWLFPSAITGSESYKLASLPGTMRRRSMPH